MEYYDFIAADRSIEELTRLIDLMSTNVTSFLRESLHFDLISNMLQELWSKGPKKVKFWSAACSSGQEPYTLAMVVHDVARSKNVDPSLVSILATDISTQILQQADAGTYNQRELKDVPAEWIKRYFRKTSDVNSRQVADSIRSMVPVQKSALHPSYLYCFSEMLEPGEVMAFRQSGLGLTLPKSPKTETTSVSFGPAADRPNWLAPTTGRYSLKQSKVIQFGIMDDRSNQTSA